MKKAYCYGDEIAEVVEYLGEIVIFRAVGERYNSIAMTAEIEVR